MTGRVMMRGFGRERLATASEAKALEAAGWTRDPAAPQPEAKPKAKRKPAAKRKPKAKSKA